MIRFNPRGFAKFRGLGWAVCSLAAACTVRNPAFDGGGTSDSGSESSDQGIDTRPPSTAESTSGSDQTTGATGLTSSSEESGTVPTRLVMFSDPSLTSGGNLGGFDGAQASCQLVAAELYPGMCGVPATAFLRLSSFGSIEEMLVGMGFPGDVPVEGPQGAPIATDLANLFASAPANTLLDAGVEAGDSRFWIGLPSGPALDNCDDWTSNAPDVAGDFGATNANGTVDASWLFGGTRPCHDDRFSFPIVCMCPA